MALLSRCRLGQMRDTSAKHGQALIVARAKQVWQMKADYAPGTPPWRITTPARRSDQLVDRFGCAACRGRNDPMMHPANPRRARPFVPFRGVYRCCVQGAFRQQNFLPKDGSLSSQAKKVSLKEIDPVFPRKLGILPKKISGLWAPR